MSTVSFTAMREATREDYELMEEDSRRLRAEVATHVLDALRQLAGYQGALKVSRLEHSLQSASRAHRDGREEDYVVAALLHDMGDTLAPDSHGALAAAVLRPFVSERIAWIVDKHPLFQTYYSAPFVGGDPNARGKYKASPFYEDCIEFCDLYDQNCFDPEYKSLPLEFFEPMVRRMFSREPWTQDGSKQVDVLK